MDVSNSTASSVSASTTPGTLQTVLDWLLKLPWRLVLVTGGPVLLIIVILAVLICCLKCRRRRNMMETEQRQKTDMDMAPSRPERDSFSGTPSRLAPLRVECSNSSRENTEMADELQPTHHETADGEMSSVFSDQEEMPSRSISVEDKNDKQPFMTPQKTHQEIANTTSKKRRDVSYIQVDLLPIVQRAEQDIISTQEATEYADIAGMLNLFDK